MNVSDTRFDLSPSDRRGIAEFEEYLFHSSETCSHCFERVREVEERRIMRGKNRQIEDVWEFHERTQKGSNEYTSWDEGAQKQYGTTFCLSCGSDCSAQHRDLTLSELKPIAANIYRYTTQHTPLSLDAARFGREVRELKGRRDTQGKEGQILAVAFARSLTSTATTSSGSAQVAAD